MFSIILTYRRSFVHDFEAEEWSKEKKDECSAWLDVNYLPVDSMSPIIMLLYSYLFCLVWHGVALFCFVYKSEIIIYIKRPWNWKNWKMNEWKKKQRWSPCRSAAVLCADYWIRRAKKIHNPLQSTARTYTQVSAQQRNRHNFQLIKIHLRTKRENNSTCFQATVVIQPN